MLIEYPKCSECQRAKRWLIENRIPFRDRQIRAENPSYEELRQWHERSRLPISAFFNTSGRLYRSLELKDKLPLMSEETQLRLLATDGTLVRRPLLISDRLVLAGFHAEQWERLKAL